MTGPRDVARRLPIPVRPAVDSSPIQDTNAVTGLGGEHRRETGKGWSHHLGRRGLRTPSRPAPSGRRNPHPAKCRRMCAYRRGAGNRHDGQASLQRHVAAESTRSSGGAAQTGLVRRRAEPIGEARASRRKRRAIAASFFHDLEVQACFPMAWRLSTVSSAAGLDAPPAFSSNRIMRPDVVDGVRDVKQGFPVPEGRACGLVRRPGRSSTVSPG